MEKLRVYAASIMAIRSTVNEADFQIDSLTMHQPALIPAESIHEAAKLCKVTAFQNWPKDQGWHSHQASISPVTEAFFEAAALAVRAGAIGEDNERAQGFAFDDSADIWAVPIKHP
jgi:hypothetical protein